MGFRSYVNLTGEMPDNFSQNVDRKFRLTAGGKPSTWLPPEGCRADTMNKKDKDEAKENEKKKPSNEDKNI